MRDDNNELPISLCDHHQGNAEQWDSLYKTRNRQQIIKNNILLRVLSDGDRDPMYTSFFLLSIHAGECTAEYNTLDMFEKRGTVKWGGARRVYSS